MALAAAQFMVIMDTSNLGIALPEMQRDLGFSQGQLQWVVNAYVITPAAVFSCSADASPTCSAPGRSLTPARST